MIPARIRNGAEGDADVLREEWSTRVALAQVDFAVAMFANWIGPRSGDTSVLDVFANEPHFRQLLLRAAVRMLLVVSELGRVDEWDTERRAAELLLSISAESRRASLPLLAD